MITSRRVSGGALLGAVMPFVMLKPSWPATFRRTVAIGAKKKTLEFAANTPVELSAAEVDAVASDIGKALVPIEFDEKARPRVITEDVIAEDEPVEEPAPQPVQKKRGKSAESSLEPVAST